MDQQDEQGWKAGGHRGSGAEASFGQVKDERIRIGLKACSHSVAKSVFCSVNLCPLTTGFGAYLEVTGKENVNSKQYIYIIHFEIQLVCIYYLHKIMLNSNRIDHSIMWCLQMNWS